MTSCGNSLTPENNKVIDFFLHRLNNSSKERNAVISIDGTFLMLSTTTLVDDVDEILINSSTVAKNIGPSISNTKVCFGMDFNLKGSD